LFVIPADRYGFIVGLPAGKGVPALGFIDRRPLTADLRQIAICDAQRRKTAEVRIVRDVISGAAHYVTREEATFSYGPR
jgi:hypothetical protein